MKQLFATLCCLFCALAANAQAHWTVNEHLFEYDMTVYFTLYHGEKSENFTNTELDNYEIAAFVDGELRGVGEWVTSGDNKWGYIRVYSNVTEGETITFKYYDKTEQKEKSIYGDEAKIAFKANSEAVGAPSAPVKFDLDNNVLPGDVTGDGEIDVTDLVSLFDYIMGTEVEDFVEDAADFNGDGEVDVTDLVDLFDYIMNQ